MWKCCICSIVPQPSYVNQMITNGKFDAVASNEKIHIRKEEDKYEGIGLRINGR